MSQLIVPGGRPAPKKDPKGPVIVAWAEIVTVSETGCVRTSKYDPDYTKIHLSRGATPEDVIGACAYIEHESPNAVDTVFDLGDCDEVFKTAFILACLPNGHIIIHDDLFVPVVPTYEAYSQLIWLAAAVIKARVSATMAAELIAPLAGDFAAKSVIAMMEQAAANNTAAGLARHG